MSDYKDFIPEGEPVPVVQKINDFVPDPISQDEVIVEEIKTQVESVPQGEPELVVVQPEEVSQMQVTPKKLTMFEQVRDAITGAVAYKEVEN